jgi:hypothetical protein
MSMPTVGDEGAQDRRKRVNERLTFSGTLAISGSIVQEAAANLDGRSLEHHT